MVERPVAPWMLQVVTWGAFTIKPVLGKTTLSNGDTTTMAITIPASAPKGSEVFGLVYSIRDVTAYDYN